MKMEIGKRIEYTMHNGAKVRGKVIAPPKARNAIESWMGENVIWMRVTSRTSRYYDHGMEIPISENFAKVIK